jgi:tetratricopeptide (TPR) repeat protein
VGDPVGSTPRSVAERAVELARTEPEQARAQAGEALRRAGPGDQAAASVAHRALALAAREQHDLPAAADHLDGAITAARRADDDNLEALARVTLASVRASEGRNADALAELARAERLATGAGAALVHFQRATVFYRLGHHDDRALPTFTLALETARQAGDRVTEALTLGNRGLLHVYADRPTAAEHDLAASEHLFHELGMDLSEADLRHNRGWAAAARGDISLALRHYQDAGDIYRRLGIERPAALMDEARTLFEANLVSDAETTAARAVHLLRSAGERADLAEALLLLAEARAAGGHPDPAPAREAQELFTEQGRPGWAALAGFTAVRVDGSTRPDARAAAHQLDTFGWVDAALDARLLAGGDDDLREVAAHRHRGPAARRVRGWHALARLRLAAGDRAGAARAASAGIQVASTNAVSLAATELRARAGVVVEPLVELGTGLALESGRPRRVLAWAERWRATGLTLAGTRTAVDADLSELRTVVRRLQDDRLVLADRADLDRRRRRLEAEVDRRARAVTGAATRLDDRLDVDALRAELGPTVLVEFVVHGERIHPISVGPAGVRRHPAVGVETVRREIRSLRLAASRAARPGGRTDPLADSARAAAAALDDLLLGGVGLGDELVLVPSGVLHAVPWPLLPSCQARTVTVTPAAQLWLRAGPAVPVTGDRRAVVVAHGVAGGTTEAAAVAACYQHVEVLVGEAATSAAVLEALAAADVVHLAVHATFRADNPLHSALHLADGPLLVHDLDRLGRTPAVVVLAACGAAQSTVDAGDELLGLTASFLRSGTRSLVASTLPVTDELAPPLMAAFHTALRHDRPSVALRRAAADTPAHAGAAFTCLGRG